MSISPLYSSLIIIEEAALRSDEFPSESVMVTRQQFLALTDWLTQQTVSYDLPNVRDAISRLCYLSRRLQGPNNGE
jgi:hypothetical protein